MEMEAPNLRQSGFTTPRRVNTAPITISTRSDSKSQDGFVETLYDHPNAKIVAFTASGKRSVQIGVPSSDSEEAGTLSWSSPAERTIAIGKMLQSTTQSIRNLMYNH